MKKRAFKIISIALILTAVLNILAACADKDTDNSTLLEPYIKIISQLNTDIQSLESENNVIHQNYEDKISALQDEVEKLSDKLAQNSTTEDTTTPVTTVPEIEILPFEYVIANGEVTIIKYTGSYQIVIIPDSIENTPVTKIGSEAFDGTDIVSITLPSTVTYIDWFAFRSCSILTDIYIPASVTKISYGTFDGSTKVKIHCDSGSYAEKYAKSYALTYIINN